MPSTAGIPGGRRPTANTIRPPSLETGITRVQRQQAPVLPALPSGHSASGTFPPVKYQRSFVLGSHGPWSLLLRLDPNPISPVRPQQRRESIPSCRRAGRRFVPQSQRMPAASCTSEVFLVLSRRQQQPSEPAQVGPQPQRPAAPGSILYHFTAETDTGEAAAPAFQPQFPPQHRHKGS